MSTWRALLGDSRGMGEQQDLPCPRGHCGHSSPLWAGLDRASSSVLLERKGRSFTQTLSPWGILFVCRVPQTRAAPRQDYRRAKCQGWPVIASSFSWAGSCLFLKPQVWHHLGPFIPPWQLQAPPRLQQETSVLACIELQVSLFPSGFPSREPFKAAVMSLTDLKGWTVPRCASPRFSQVFTFSGHLYGRFIPGGTHRTRGSPVMGMRQRMSSLSLLDLSPNPLFIPGPCCPSRALTDSSSRENE